MARNFHKQIWWGFGTAMLTIFVMLYSLSKNSTGKDELELETNVVSNERFPVLVWSSDFHISPVADIKYLLSQFGVKFIDKSLSGHCHLSNTCETDLRVVTKNNGIRLGYCPNQLIKEFYDANYHDAEFQSVDIILCTHAISMCELFMPFGKPLVAIASTRWDAVMHVFRVNHWVTFLTLLQI